MELTGLEPRPSYVRVGGEPTGRRLAFAVAQINNAGLDISKSFVGVVDSYDGPVRDLLKDHYQWYPDNPDFEPDGRGCEPDWSRDGQKLVLSKSAISVIDLKTFRFTSLKTPGLSPSWAPDARRIAFASRPPQQNDVNELVIWTMNADGSDPRQLTGNN